MDISKPSLKYLFPVLHCSKGPTSPEISRLEAIWLAHSDFHNYFEFNRDWDFVRMDAELRTLFTRLFLHLDSWCSKVSLSH